MAQPGAIMETGKLAVAACFGMNPGRMSDYYYCTPGRFNYGTVLHTVFKAFPCRWFQHHPIQKFVRSGNIRTTSAVLSILGLYASVECSWISTPLPLPNLKVLILLRKALGHTTRDTSHTRGMVSTYTCATHTRIPRHSSKRLFQGTTPAWHDMASRKGSHQDACLTLSDLTTTLIAKMHTKRP